MTFISARRPKQAVKVHKERKKHHSHQVQVKSYVLFLRGTAILVRSVGEELHHAYGFARSNELKLALICPNKHKLYSSATITGKADASFEHTKASKGKFIHCFALMPARNSELFPTKCRDLPKLKWDLNRFTVCADYKTTPKNPNCRGLEAIQIVVEIRKGIHWLHLNL